MARKRISEYKAKSMILPALGLSYAGVQVKAETLRSDLNMLRSDLNEKTKFVVKVDQGIKKRFKNGLVALNADIQTIQTKIKEWQDRGYEQFLVEPMVSHQQSEERYIAIERVREGLKVYTSNVGGVDIEENAQTIKQTLVKDVEGDEVLTASDSIGISKDTMATLLQAINDYQIAFLEINPLVVQGNALLALDMAIEVDSAGVFTVNNAWTTNDFVSYSSRKLTLEEADIVALAENSQSSFKLEVINPNGAVFLLLSGGGASVVVADEVFELGKAKELANYGEYSGNPSLEETYLYTKALLSLMLKSKAKKKVLIIGGGVANFTDVRVTFKGIIKALEEVAEELRKNKVLVYVRRGGPHQQEGLQNIKSFLEKETLYGLVSGPEMVLTDVVKPALAYLDN